MNKQEAHRTTRALIVLGFIVMLLLSVLAGCSTTVPVAARFADAPVQGLGRCPQLQTVPGDVKLSELTATVTTNYSAYYECAVKVDQWNEWYATQKRIFESVE